VRASLILALHLTLLVTGAAGTLCAEVLPPEEIVAAAASVAQVPRGDLRPAEPELVRIPGGCFQMGSPPGEPGRHVDERRHRVCVDDFALARFEVTEAQWKALMGRQGSPTRLSGCGDCPVVNVSWGEALTYIERLNARTGKRYRLPTEAEWEFACRSGGREERYCGGDDLDRLAWYEGNSRAEPQPVGRKRPNGLGLCDMSGNVSEWTCSIWDKAYGGAHTRCSDRTERGHRVHRGGSWEDGARWLRSAARDWFAPAYRYEFLGFRLAGE
jgi:formylglycine-generating enzyme required for sulfatase activity